MQQSKRRSTRALVRSGAFSTTATFDLGPGAMDGYDALLIHYVATVTSGAATIKVSAIADAPATRAVVCDNAAWTTASISGTASATLIIADPLPSDLLLTITSASAVFTALSVWIEKVKTGL